MVANMGGTNTLDSLSDNYILDVRNGNSNTLIVNSLTTGIFNFITSTTYGMYINNPETVFFEILSDYQ